MEVRLLSVGEVAERLKCSETWVNQLNDELRPYVLGNGHRVYLSDLVEDYAGRRDARRAEKLTAKARAKRAKAVGR